MSTGRYLGRSDGQWEEYVPGNAPPVQKAEQGELGEMPEGKIRKFFQEQWKAVLGGAGALGLAAVGLLHGPTSKAIRSTGKQVGRFHAERFSGVKFEEPTREGTAPDRGKGPSVRFDGVTDDEAKELGIIVVQGEKEPFLRLKDDKGKFHDIVPCPPYRIIFVRHGKGLLHGNTLGVEVTDYTEEGEFLRRHVHLVSANPALNSFSPISPLPLERYKAKFPSESLRAITSADDTGDSSHP